MALVSSRNRLIYFRVSQEEFTRFRTLAELKGARSLSDLVRDALENLDAENRGESSNGEFLLRKLKDLQASITEVKEQLENLNRSLPAATGSARQSNDNQGVFAK